jgi:membrane fusion protein (multidrug efflux system)
MPYDDSETRSDARPAEAPETQRGGAPKPDEAKGRERDAERSRQRRKPWIIGGLIVLALLAVTGGVIWWLTTANLVSTDDAFTDGRAITIAPQVSGYVTALDVNDNQFVRTGDVIVQIDQRDYIAARDQARGALESARGQLDAARAALDLARVTYPAQLAAAQAQLTSAQAGLSRAQSDYRRQTSVAPGATTRQNIDQATAAEREAAAAVAQAEANVREAQPINQQIAEAAAKVEQLEGDVAQAQAKLDQAELNLSHTTVRAPQDGWVTQRNVERGNYLTAGASIMSLVSPQVWITANFKETQLNRMRPGQPVDISIDAYPALHLKGHVDSVQLGSGSKFSAFPAENATGNYVKIVQRVPVKIDIDSGMDPSLPLPLGISAVPTVTVN